MKASWNGRHERFWRCSKSARRLVFAATPREREETMDALPRHRTIGKAKRRQSLVVACVGQNGDAFFETPLDFLAPIESRGRLCVVSDDIGTDAASLLFDPLPVIAREDGEDRDELAPVHSCEHFHIEMALFDHLAHRRPVFGPKAGRLRHRHLVLRHHHRAHFTGALGIAVIGLRVNGYTMTDRELDLLRGRSFPAPCALHRRLCRRARRAV